MTYLLHRDRQDHARGNLLDLGLGLGVVRHRVDGLVVGRVGDRVGETLRLHFTKRPSKILVGILLIICVSI